MVNLSSYSKGYCLSKTFNLLAVASSSSCYNDRLKFPQFGKTIFCYSNGYNYKWVNLYTININLSLRKIFVNNANHNNQ